MSFFINTSNYIFKKLDIKFKKDYLWEETKRRIFFKKLLHLFYYSIFCCVFLVYLQHIIKDRPTLESIGILADVKYYYQHDYEKMFVNTFFYLLIWFFIYVLSFTFRRIHEIIYLYWYMIFVWSYLFLMYNNYGLWILSLTYIHYLTIIGCLLLTLYHYYCNLVVATHTDVDDIDDDVFNHSDEDEDLISFDDEIFVEQNREYIAEVIRKNEEKERLDNWYNELDNIQSSAEFKGNLQDIPSAYSVDPKSSMELLLVYKQQVLMDSQEYGMLDIIENYGRIFKLYPEETATQNYILNIKRILSLSNYFVITEQDSSETFIEFHARYQRTEILQEANSREDLEDFDEEEKLREYNDRFEVKKVYLDPWYSSLWFNGMSSKEALWFSWWVSDQVPFIVKLVVLFSRFFKEFKSGAKSAKESDSVLFFSDAFYSFFGIKRHEEKFVIRFDDGYVAWVRGQPTIVHFDSLDFDPELYSAPTQKLPPLGVQFLNMFKNVFNVVKNVFLFFYNLITSWGSISFWIYVIKSSVYLPKIVIYLLVKIYEIFIEILNYFFGRIYNFISDIILFLLYYIWSFVSYFLIILKRVKILFRGVKPAGPYSLYNSFITKDIRYIYLEKPIMFFEREKEIKKIYKSLRKTLRMSKKRELFLIWSSNKISENVS